MKSWACKNPKCRDERDLNPIPLCASCRWLGARAFGLGAALAGVVWGVAKLAARFL